MANLYIITNFVTYVNKPLSIPLLCTLHTTWALQYIFLPFFVALIFFHHYCEKVNLSWIRGVLGLVLRVTIDNLVFPHHCVLPSPIHIHQQESELPCILLLTAVSFVSFKSFYRYRFINSML